MKLRLVLSLALLYSISNAADSSQVNRYNFLRDVKPLLQKYCYECHDEDVMKGDVQLNNLDPDMINGKDGAKWHAALDVVNTSDMPPKKKKQPSDSERRILVDWITDNLKLAKKINKGKVQTVLRRLTRRQYQNVLNDILGIDLEVAESLPPDSPSGMGFLNDGASQFASPLLLETYQEIARRAVKKAIGPATKPPVTRYRVDFGKDISEVRNSQKHGFQSIALSGHDYMPYVIDQKGSPLSPDAKTETGKKVSDVLRTISVGMRGSEGNRYLSNQDSLILFGANPQPNRAPQSWRAPNPNAKLLIRHEFPNTGNFRFVIEASKAWPSISRFFVEPLNKTRGKINNKFKPLVSWSNNLLKKEDNSIVIPASAFQLKTNLILKDNTVSTLKGDKGEFEVAVSIPVDGYYQIDLARDKSHNSRTDKILNFNSNILGAKRLSFRIPTSKDLKLKSNKTVNQLLYGFIKAGSYKIIFSNMIPAISHLAITPLKAETISKVKIKREKLISDREKALMHFKDTPGVLRAFLGSRGDDGENYKFIDGLQEVNGKPGERKKYEFTGRLENFPLPFVDPKSVDWLSGIMVLGFYNHHLSKKQGGIGPAVSVHSITFEAPYFESWPTKSYKLLFNSEKPQTDLQSTRKIIYRFLNKAFRRKVSSTEVDRYVNFWKSIKDDYKRYEDSIAEVFIAVLCSPEFIYIAEPPAQKKGKYVDHFQLASRLSFFLWNTGPDYGLLRDAYKGSLLNNLDRHIERMLKDKRSNEFIQSFGSQWLNLERFTSIDLDKKLLNRFNPHIRSYMIKETQTFLKFVLDNNLSIKNFIDSDFVMLNEHLAEYYGIKGVQGYEFRPVKVDRSLNRGGLLSQGSFLIGHSDGKQGHPIKRGVWLMKKMMATEPPPPPPNVPEIDEAVEGFDAMTMAQKLEVHREKASCNDCHRKIDPWGLAFEEYDALGLFHKNSGSASEPDISEISKLKNKLQNKKMDLIAQSVIEHVLSYALGRELSYLDEEYVQELVKQAGENGYRFKDILKSIIKHEIFRRL